MKYLLLTAALLPTAANAYDYSHGSQFVAAQTEEGYGIDVFNGADYGPRMNLHAVETPYGVVQVSSHHTDNGNGGCCADMFRVEYLPAGVTAHPSELMLEEGEAGFILLLPYVGS